MSEVTLIDVRKEVFEENDQCASEIRANLNKCHTRMINLMGSPGCGKTTFLLRTIKELKDKWKIAVIEGDLDSLVDSKKLLPLTQPQFRSIPAELATLKQPSFSGH